MNTSSVQMTEASQPVTDSRNLSHFYVISEVNQIALTFLFSLRHILEFCVYLLTNGQRIAIKIN
jgi:hypothetical protein